MQSLPIAIVLTAACALGQNLTAHPQETTDNSSGNLVPFGVLAAGNFAEGRTHVLIRGVELPGPGAVLLGMDVHGQNVANLGYLSLDITVSPTTATSLSLTFANNLPLPQTLLSTTNQTIGWNGQWVPITFTTPYVHDGSSALVIEIKKVVDPATFAFLTCSTSSDPQRGDLPPMAYEFGGPGSGAAQNPTARFTAAALAVRLHWAGAPTVRLLSNRFGPNNTQFAIGGSITHTVAGSPNELFINLLAQSFLNPPQALAPVVGEWRVNGPTMNLGVMPAGGEAVTTINIPNNPQLVGQYFTWQSLTVAPGLTGAWFTNAADAFIRN
ncbi:MAG: hypothetical protein IPK26_00710 [Planctomycetes bacterium]|nr:hypothetical protein [Planctomycetota bacterium]